MAAILTAGLLFAIGAALASPPTLVPRRTVEPVASPSPAPTQVTNPIDDEPAEPIQTVVEAPKLRLPGDTQLRDGDLIFVQGRSLHSRVVAMSFAGERYTHVGIVRMIDGKPWVIHSAPDFKQGGPLHGSTFCETLEFFLEHHPFHQGDVYRVTDASAGQAAADVAQMYADRKTPFDAKGNTRDDSQLYCYELVWRAYRGAGLDLAEDRMVQADLWFVRGPVVLASSIIDSPQVQHLVELELR